MNKDYLCMADELKVRARILLIQNKHNFNKTDIFIARSERRMISADIFFVYLRLLFFALLLLYEI